MPTHRHGQLARLQEYLAGHDSHSVFDEQKLGLEPTVFHGERQFVKNKTLFPLMEISTPAA